MNNSPRCCNLKRICVVLMTYKPNQSTTLPPNWHLVPPRLAT